MATGVSLTQFLLPWQQGSICTCIVKLANPENHYMVQKCCWYLIQAEL